MGLRTGGGSERVRAKRATDSASVAARSASSPSSRRGVRRRGRRGEGSPSETTRRSAKHAIPCHATKPEGVDRPLTPADTREADDNETLTDGDPPAEGAAPS